MRDLSREMKQYQYVIYAIMISELSKIKGSTKLSSEQVRTLSLMETEMLNLVKKETDKYLRKVNVSLYYQSNTTYDIIIDVVVDGFYHKKGNTTRGYSGSMIRMTDGFKTKRYTTVTDFDYVNLKAQGYDVDKEWVYTYESKTMRQTHHSHDGVTSDDNGYFYIDGYKTIGPGHFGVPSQDYNCKCRVRLTNPKRIVDEL